MFRKMRAFVEKHYDVLSYLFFGGLTTVVNYMVYFPCYNWLGTSATVATVLSWVVAVAFAFITNKPFVFKSYDWSYKVVGPELTKFVGCRIGSGLLETGIIFVTVDLLMWNGNVMKIVTGFLTVVLNYIASKWLIFIKKK